MNTSDREWAPEFPGFPAVPSGPEGDLLSDCRRIVRMWATAPVSPAAPVPASTIRGTTVPAASAHAVAGMPEYGG